MSTPTSAPTRRTASTSSSGWRTTASTRSSRCAATGPICTPSSDPAPSGHEASTGAREPANTQSHRGPAPRRASGVCLYGVYSSALATGAARRSGELRAEFPQRHVTDALARLRGRDHNVLRDHELDVAAVLGEEQVAGPETRQADRPAHAQLVPARARDLPADRALGRMHEARRRGPSSIERGLCHEATRPINGTSATLGAPQSAYLVG